MDLFRSPNTSIMRKFLAVFSHENYHYFVVNVNRRTHVIRLCQVDNGNQASPFGTFASHFELELGCANSESATAATFDNSTEQFWCQNRHSYLHSKCPLRIHYTFVPSTCQKSMNAWIRSLRHALMELEVSVSKEMDKLHAHSFYQSKLMQWCVHLQLQRQTCTRSAVN